jgi:hypothetical protein
MSQVVVLIQDVGDPITWSQFVLTPLIWSVHRCDGQTQMHGWRLRSSTALPSFMGMRVCSCVAICVTRSNLSSPPGTHLHLMKVPHLHVIQGTLHFVQANDASVLPTFVWHTQIGQRVDMAIPACIYAVIYTR